MRRAIVSTSVLAFLIAGCTTLGPEPGRPDPRVDLASGYANARDPSLADSLTPGPGPMADWWRVLGDAELDGLVRDALARNLDVEAALARVRQARAQRRIAGADRLPTLDAVGVAQRSRTSANIGPPIGGGQSGGQPGGGQGGGQQGGGQQAGLPGTENDFFQAGFDASWELDLWGRNKRRTQAAGERLRSAELGLEDVRLTLVSDLVRDYVQLREMQSRLAAARENLGAARRTATIVRERERGGLVTELDTVRADAAVTQLEALVPQYEIQIRQSAQRLAVLSAREPGALLDRLERPGALPTVPRRVAAGMPSGLLQRRPDIRRAQADLDALTYDIGVAKADLYPRFTIDGAFGFQSFEADTLLEWSSRYWSFGLNVFAPLFDGGRRRATVDLRRAQAEQALAQYRLAVLRAFQDVEDALVAFDRDQDRLAVQEREAAQRARAVSLAQERYRAGLVNLLEVLQAEQDLYAARDRLVTTRAAVAADWAALQKALGGGWTPPEEKVETRG